jgi:hypothetical protein
MCATAKTNQQATTIKTGTWRRDFADLGFVARTGSIDDLELRRTKHAW